MCYNWYSIDLSIHCHGAQRQNRFSTLHQTTSIRDIQRRIAGRFFINRISRRLLAFASAIDSDHFGHFEKEHFNELNVLKRCVNCLDTESLRLKSIPSNSREEYELRWIYLANLNPLEQKLEISKSIATKCNSKSLACTQWISPIAIYVQRHNLTIDEIHWWHGNNDELNSVATQLSDLQFRMDYFSQRRITTIQSFPWNSNRLKFKTRFPSFQFERFG